jgi:ATP-dependent DNA helicase RecG
MIECANDAGEPDHLLFIEVETSELVHQNKKDEVFLRVGDENRKLAFAQRQELLYDKGQASYEATVVKDATLAELADDLLADYAEAVSHPDPIRLLKARGLITRKDEIALGALLLFGKSPQERYPEAAVRVSRYRGTERGTGARQQLLDDIRCEGPIPVVLDRAQQEIYRLLPTRRALGTDGRFQSVGIIPRDAWLEGLVNAVIHRSYSLTGDHIRVEIFDDRVEIESPGRFPGLVDPTDPLTVTRFARNPRIARVCADLRFGQELGEGIRRIFEEMRLAGLADPEYRQTSGSVRLTLPSTAVDRELEARLPAGGRDLVRLIREHERPSTGDLVSATGLSRPVVISRLRLLEQLELVEWVGNSPNDPRAYWRLPVGETLASL